MSNQIWASAPCPRFPTPTPAGARHSRHSFSSLLSKQSGSPSHCQAPGMHRPLLHMKFPGMLHSLVKLFPGSSWLSVKEKGQGVQKAQQRQQGPEAPPERALLWHELYRRGFR